MYPMNWAAASDDQRDREETRQRRSRESNGGMGFASDYGEGYRAEAVDPQVTASARAAAVSPEVSLG
jgi:hypothetical protein